jgi:hypothetical protein
MRPELMAVYEFRSNRPKPKGVDPNVVGRLIRQIAGPRGVCPPEALVEASTPANAPLHGCFEWDGEEAIRRLNIRIARSLIACVVEVKIHPRTGEHNLIPAFASVEVESGQRGYRRVVDVLDVPEQREFMLEQARRDAEAFVDRYRHLRELGAVLEAMRRAVDALAKGKRRRQRKQEPARPRA